MPETIDQPIEKVQIRILGAKDYPMVTAKIPAFLCEDMVKLIADAQKLNPTVTADDVARSIWRLGSRAVKNNLVRGIAPIQENTDAALRPNSESPERPVNPAPDNNAGSKSETPPAQ